LELEAIDGFRVQPLGSGQCAVFASTGDFAFLSPQELELLQQAPTALPVAKLAELYAKHIVTLPGQPGMSRLRASRQAGTGGEMVTIHVPTSCEKASASGSSARTASPDVNNDDASTAAASRRLKAASWIS
jgi:hypothetical protein